MSKTLLLFQKNSDIWCIYIKLCIENLQALLLEYSATHNPSTHNLSPFSGPAPIAATLAATQPHVQEEIRTKHASSQG